MQREFTSPSVALDDEDGEEQEGASHTLLMTFITVLVEGHPFSLAFVLA